MSSRGETFVTEDVHEAVLEKYPEYKDIDFHLQSTTPIDAWSDDQLPGAFTVEMSDCETGEVVARFGVRVKFGIEDYDYGQRYIVVEKVTVRRIADGRRRAKARAA